MRLAPYFFSFFVFARVHPTRLFAAHSLRPSPAPWQPHFSPLACYLVYQAHHYLVMRVHHDLKVVRLRFLHLHDHLHHQRIYTCKSSVRGACAHKLFIANMPRLQLRMVRRQVLLAVISFCTWPVRRHTTRISHKSRGCRDWNCSSYYLVAPWGRLLLLV